MRIRDKLQNGSFTRRRFARRIATSLALHKRNEVRSDGLLLEGTWSRLAIRWRARDVHPWDSHLSGKERRLAFLYQSMVDTESAVLRMFQHLPEIDEIDLAVIDLKSDNTLLSGTVHRGCLLSTCEPKASVRMRLGLLGINVHFDADSTVKQEVDETRNSLRIA
jgi:hypothetical protein